LPDGVPAHAVASPVPTPGAMLELCEVQARYGESQALFGVSLFIGQGEVVSLLGRNGMGKTTTISAIMSIVPPCGGEVVFRGEKLCGLPSYAIARRGIGLVPEGRQVFPNLTVRENLVATAANRNRHNGPWSLEAVLDLFPGLAPRVNALAGVLSGGEQQMLSIGRALMTNPELLILDEATEGLAPLVRADIWRALRRLKEQHQSILVVDKNLGALLELADRHYILERGRVRWLGTSQDLAADHAARARYLGV
jgi:branched-chain amino acid transport system ATP-binding protein